MPLKLIIRDPKTVKLIKQELENDKVLNKERKIEKQDDKFHIYTKLLTLDDKFSHLEYEQYSDEEETSRSKLTIESIVQRYNDEHGTEIHVPKRWSIYPPMILFNTKSESSSFPPDLCESILSNQQRLFGVNELTHIAINQPIIESDIMRRPHNIQPIHGDFGPTLPIDHSPSVNDFNCAFWCHVNQNGIYQTWAPKYTMFSRGNIKEKSRILHNFKNLKDSLVFDFYCGIGYFSLSYLKNGGKLLCWELNPWSVEGFKRSLQHQRIKYKIYKIEDIFNVDDLNQFQVCIFQESNENVLNRVRGFDDNSLPISHINLGLLPSSKLSWGVAKELILKKSNSHSVVHVHENYHIDHFDELKNEIKSYFAGEILHLEKVKTFAPDIWHVVVDVKVPFEGKS